MVGRSFGVSSSLSLASLTDYVFVGARQALRSQTNTRTSLFQLIPRQYSYFFCLAARSSGTREEIQVENPPRSGKEVESTSVWAVQTRKYTMILPSQPD